MTILKLPVVRSQPTPPGGGQLLRRALREIGATTDVVEALRQRPNLAAIAVRVCEYFTHLIPVRSGGESLNARCLRSASIEILDSVNTFQEDGVAYRRFIHALLRDTSDALYWYVFVWVNKKREVWDPAVEPLSLFWNRHGREPMMEPRGAPWDTIAPHDFRAMLAVRILAREDFTRLDGGLRAIIDLPIRPETVV